LDWFLSSFNLRAWRWVKNYELEKAPNVTLIYGPDGTGKSTLLQYLYKTMGFREGGIYTNALSFSRQYSFACQEKCLSQFRQRYRSARLILIDDLQDLAGKIHTIEELLSTYEYLLGKEGKFVLTLKADLPELNFLGEHLASRFKSGVIIPIDRPQEQEMLCFVEDYIFRKQLFMDSVVPKVIAKRTNNLTDAVRIIKKFIKFAELQEDELSIKCFEEFWKNEIRENNLIPNPGNIIRTTSQIMDIPAEELVGPSRKPDVSKARQLAILLIRTLCQTSYPDLGCFFNRKHPTMITACQKAQEMLEKDHEFKCCYETVLNIFKEYEKE